MGSFDAANKSRPKRAVLMMRWSASAIESLALDFGVVVGLEAPRPGVPQSLHR